MDEESIKKSIKNHIIENAYQIDKDSKDIAPYVVIAQPRRYIEEQAAQMFSDLSSDIDLCGYSKAYTNVVGEKIDVARNILMLRSIGSGAKYMLFVGEDTVLPYDAFTKLHETCENNPGSCAVGVYYMKCSSPMIMIKNDKWIVPANVDPGQIYPVWQAGMDCMLIPIDILKKMYDEDKNDLFCVIVNNLRLDDEKTITFIGEDNWFYNQLHKRNIPIYCNTDVQCLHVDLESGKYTSHPSTNEDNYYTQIKLNGRLTLADKRRIDKRWSDRIPTGTYANQDEDNKKAPD